MPRSSVLLRSVLAPLTALVLVLAACGGDDGDDGAAGTAGDTTTSASTSSSTTTTAPPALRILVTNDDGVGAPGIDALVQGLRDLEAVELVVVAPAENQSGSSDTTSEVPPGAGAARTAGGHEATAVDGTPADAVSHAFEEMEVEVDLVVSGVNEGQNVGQFVELSGTVGAARTGARNGVPALAVSQGLADEPDFPAAVGLALDWIEDFRSGGAEGEAFVENLNVPTCEQGEIKGLVEVPVVADEERNPFEVDCTTGLSDPAEVDDDIEGLINGFATLSELGF